MYVVCVCACVCCDVYGGATAGEVKVFPLLAHTALCVYSLCSLLGLGAKEKMRFVGMPQEYGLYGHQGLFQPCQTCNLEPCRDSEQPFREECSADTSSCSTLPLLPVLAFTVFFSVSTQDLFVSVSLEKPSLPGAQ